VDEALLYFEAAPMPLTRLIKTLHTARKQEIKAVASALRAFPVQEMDRAIRECVSALAVATTDDQQLTIFLSDTSIQRYQAVYDLLLPATIPEDAETRHELRIAIKKWRYLLETLGQVCLKDYRAALDTLKEYQTLLGSLNDLIEFGALCSTLNIPDDERQVVAAILSKDAGKHLARFIETVATRPLQYTFIP
jgi:CHAD domain-containing protein